MGLKLFRLSGVISVFVLLLVVIFPCEAGAAQTYEWKNTETIVESEMKFPYDTQATICKYDETYVDLYPNLLDQRLCSQTREGNVFGSIIQNGNVRYYYGDQNSQLYPFVSSICRSYDNCIYIPQKDMLVSLELRNGGIVRSLVIYKNFLSRTTFSSETTPDRQYKDEHYNFNSSNPDYIFENTVNGYAWPVLSVGVSSNGDWLGVAFYGRGVGILNLSSMQMRRISATPRFMYGYGSDPSPEVAVSDTGRNVLVVGKNSSLSLFDVDEACGDDPLSVWPTSDNPPQHPCVRNVLDFSKIIDRFKDAYKPRFFDDGGRLSFTAFSYTGNSKGVVVRHPTIAARAVSYIAMGDSFTSGEGETDDGHYLAGTNLPLEKCHVSDRSYPFVFMGLIGLSSASARNVACSGAKVVDTLVDLTKSYTGQKDLAGRLGLDYKAYALLRFDALVSFKQGRELQENFIATHKPQFTTIGIGGNDAGLMDIMKACIMPGSCEFAQPGPIRYGVAKKIQSLYPTLLRLYGKILADSPGIKLAVIGYPDPFGEGDRCSVVLDTMINSEERKFFRTTISYLNQIMRDAAKRVGVQYVDTWNAYGEHALCGSSSEKAIQHIVFGDDIGIFKESRWFNMFGKESFHPTPFGHQLLAGVLSRQVPSLTHSVCSGGYYVCPDDSVLAGSLAAYWREGIATSENPPDLQGVDATDASVDIGGSIDITVPSGTFAPGSNIVIELHSEPVGMGSWAAGVDGSLHVSVIVPDTIPSGIHVLHMFGVSGIGSNIDVYSVLGVGEPLKAETTNDTVSERQIDKKAAIETEQNTEDYVPSYSTVSASNTFSDLSTTTSKPGALNVEAKTEEGKDIYNWTYYFIAGGFIAVVVIGVVLFKRRRLN